MSDKETTEKNLSPGQVAVIALYAELTQNYISAMAEAATIWGDNLSLNDIVYAVLSTGVGSTRVMPTPAVWDEIYSSVLRDLIKVTQQEVQDAAVESEDAAVDRAREKLS